MSLTWAGALLPLSLILTPATGLVAQVLEVHLNLLAVLLHQGFTCSRDREYLTYSVAHTLALGGGKSDPEWDIHFFGLMEWKRPPSPGSMTSLHQGEPVFATDDLTYVDPDVVGTRHR